MGDKEKRKESLNGREEKKKEFEWEGKRTRDRKWKETEKPGQKMTSEKGMGDTKIETKKWGEID